MLASPRQASLAAEQPKPAKEGEDAPAAAVEPEVARRGPPERMPMWVCPIKEQLKLGKITLHEELKSRELLIDYLTVKADERKGVLFISQVWLGYDHPDPLNVKYGVLCEVLKRAQAGLLDFQIDFEEELCAGWSSLPAKKVQEMLTDGLVWLDYQSIPQRDIMLQQMHIDCLALYVRHCTFFVALVPPAEHQSTGELVDVRHWAGRGWCRAELLCNVMSDDPAPFLKIESATCRRIATARDFILHPVGSGQFTHEGDRDRISNMMNRLLGVKISTLRKLDSKFTMRLLLSIQAHMLSKLDIDTTDDSDLASWLDCFSFKSPLEGQPSGWSALRCAVYANRLDLAEELIRAKADVEAPLSHDCTRAAYFHGKGMTILQGASLLRDSPEAIKLLLRNKADVNRTWEGGFSAVFAAAVGGRAENLEALLDARADVSRRDGAGGNLLHVACAHGHGRLLEVLERRCPEIQWELNEAEGVGFGYLSAGIMLDRGGVEAQQLALAMKADVNHRAKVQAPWLQKLVQKAQAACYVSTQPTLLDRWAANAPGMTPLLWAAFFGNVPAIRLLLEHDADTGATNEYGRSALALAAMNGHRVACQVLLEAGLPASQEDAWSRDAGHWAAQQGDVVLQKILQAAGASPDNGQLQGCASNCRCQGNPDQFVEVAADPVLAERGYVRVPEFVEPSPRHGPREAFPAGKVIKAR